MRLSVNNLANLQCHVEASNVGCPRPVSIDVRAAMLLADVVKDAFDRYILDSDAESGYAD